MLTMITLREDDAKRRYREALCSKYPVEHLAVVSRCADRISDSVFRSVIFYCTRSSKIQEDAHALLELLERAVISRFSEEEQMRALIRELVRDLLGLRPPPRS